MRNLWDFIEQDCLGPDGTSLALQEELDQTRLRLDEQKQYTLRRLVVWQRLQKLANTRSDLQTLLTAAESAVVAEEQELPGIDVDDVRDMGEPLEADAMRTAVRKALRETTAADVRLLREAAAGNATTLACERVERKSLHLRVRQLRHSVRAEQRALRETLEKCVERGAQLLAMDEGTKAAVAHARWAVAKSDAMRRKVALLRHQVLVDTYTTSELARLAALRVTVEQQIAACREEIETGEESLAAYRAGGEVIKRIVVEYQRVLDEIESREWALAELDRAERRY